MLADSQCSKQQQRFAPDPPRRQCSVPNDGHYDIGVAYSSPQHQIYAHHQQQQLNHHHQTQSHHGTLHAYNKTHPQPVYANFVGTTHQTTVEIHSEKTHDSKVSPLNSTLSTRNHITVQLKLIHIIDFRGFSQLPASIQLMPYHSQTIMPVR